ncbi:MAG: V-type ATP synthase subunit I [Clostridia bacterium]|nr:V-type ATP synthase subunit I [Clostridia bacterium]
MKRLTVAAMRADEESIMRALQDAEAVEIIESGGEGADDAAYKRAEERRRRLSEAYEFLKPYGKKGGSLFAPTPYYTVEELQAQLAASGPLADEAELLEAQLAELNAEADKLNSTLSYLSDWVRLSTPIEALRDTKNVRFYFGYMSYDALTKLEVPEEACVQAISGADVCAVMAAAHSSCADALYARLHELNFADYSFPALTGTAEENCALLRERLARLQERTATVEQRLLELSDRRDALLQALEAASIEASRHEHALRTLQLDSTFVLEGWIKADDESRVRDAISACTDAFYFDVRDPLEGETPPTVVINPPAVTPFESVTNLYSTPAYSGIDPAPMLMPFYMLFFGMMLADTGYGLILMLGCLLFAKVKRPRGNMAQLVSLLTWCGGATVLCGMMTGSFFGIEWTDLLGEASPFPFLMDPMDNMMGMMILCCGLGILHMLFGIGIKMYMCFRDGDWKEAVFNNFSWMLLMLGLVAILGSMFLSLSWLSTAGVIFAALGALMLLFFSNRKTNNPLKRMGSGLAQLYNITSYIGDTLSYVRILALGLAGGAMGMVFNLMGSMVFNAFSGLGTFGVVLGAIAAAPLLIALHAFSLFINTLGAYVHTARLQFVEFFGKFYEDNGRPFTPLRYDTRNVGIKR